ASRPPRPGICTSRMRQCGSASSRESSSCCADANVRACNPYASQRRRNATRTCSSSSTMAIDGRMRPVRRVGRQEQMKRGAAGKIVLAPQTATVRRRNGSPDRKSQPEPLGLRGEEGLEDAVLTANRKSQAAIGDPQFDVLISAPNDLEVQLPV